MQVVFSYSCLNVPVVKYITSDTSDTSTDTSDTICAYPWAINRIYISLMTYNAEASCNRF